MNLKSLANSPTISCETLLGLVTKSLRQNVHLRTDTLYQHDTQASVNKKPIPLVSDIEPDALSERQFV